MIWVTTAPNPRAYHGGPDAGQRGWKCHAFAATDTTTFEALRYQRALCGLRASHGWDVDLFITDKCKRCQAAELILYSDG